MPRGLRRSQRLWFGLLIKVVFESYRPHLYLLPCIDWYQKLTFVHWEITYLTTKTLNSTHMMSNNTHESWYFIIICCRTHIYLVSSFFLCCQITASEVVIIVVVVTVAVCVQAGDFCHWAECILLLLLRGATPMPWCPEVPTRGPRFTWSTSSKSSISSSSSSSKGSTVTKEEFLAFF